MKFNAKTASGRGICRTGRTGRTGLTCVMALALSALAFVLSARTSLSAESPSAAFDYANKLYEQGKYAEAAAAYEKLLQPGHTSPALYFNLGNAEFKAGQIGQAIFAYRKVGQLTPRDPDLSANLQFARNQIQGPSLTPGRMQAWLGRLTLNEWTLLTATSLWLLLLSLALLQWRPAFRPALRNWLVFLSATVVLLGACLGAALCFGRYSESAIVVSKDLPVRQGPFEESQTAFVAHDGAELRVLDQKDDWLQVSADPRRIGWLKRKDVLTIAGG